MSIMSPSTNETSAIVSVWSCLAMPTPILPPNPSFLWQLLPGPGNMPTGPFLIYFFFCIAPTFLLIASVSCGATVHALLKTSSQVKLRQLHTVTSAGVQRHPHGRWEAKECVWLWETLQETKGKLLRAVQKKKKTLLVTVTHTHIWNRDYQESKNLGQSYKRLKVKPMI